MLRRLGAVQLDTISVLARSMSWSRTPGSARCRGSGSSGPTGIPGARRFEYWSHAACVLPIEEWPCYAFRRRALRARGHRWHQSHERTCAEVLARLRADGPLTATQLGGAKAGGAWWDWSTRRSPSSGCWTWARWSASAGTAGAGCTTWPSGSPRRAAGHRAHRRGVPGPPGRGAGTRAGRGHPGRPDRLPPAARLTSGQAEHADLAADSALAAGLTPVTVEVAGKPVPGGPTRPRWPRRRAAGTVPPCSPRSTRWSGTASAPGGCSASTTAWRPTCPRPSGCTGTTPCRCWPGAGWSAGSIRCARARPWWPASCPWTPRRRRAHGPGAARGGQLGRLLRSRGRRGQPAAAGRTAALLS